MKTSHRILLSAVILGSCVALNNSSTKPFYFAKKFDVQTLPTAPVFSRQVAAAVMGEAGWRSYRESGTIGFALSPNHRLKFTGEYNRQHLKYHPLEEHQWVSQYAVGGEFQFLLKKSIFKSIEMGSAYAHTFSEPRIEGSNGYYSFVGSTVSLWKCAYFSFTLNYDYVRSSNILASGWGSTVSLLQQLPQDFSFRLEADFEKPFFNYEALLNWKRSFKNWGIFAGLFTSFTDGNKGAPNLLTGGLRLGFTFGGSKDKPSNCADRTFHHLAEWIETPAVRVPLAFSHAK